MNSLVGILAATTAGNAIDLASQAAGAVAAPFEAVLGATIARRQAAEAVEAPKAPTASVEDQVAARLAEILDSAGAGPGEVIELRVDSESGEIAVEGAHPLADLVEAALAEDEDLTAGILQLSEQDERGTFPPPFDSSSTLQLSLGDDPSTITMTWL